MPDTEAILKCKKAVIALGTRFPHFLPIHSRIRDRYVECDSLKTMGIEEDGTIRLNPTFVLRIPLSELSGVLAHEMLHLVYQHAARVQSRDHDLWNCAADMAINTALRNDMIKLPRFALFPPESYTGDILAEDIYDFLLSTRWELPIERGEVCNGCGMGKARGLHGERGEESDWAQVGREISALIKTIGRGSTAIARLLDPRVPRIPWKNILRHGFNLACARVARDWTTYSKRSRRSPAEGVQLPGWTGAAPTVAIAVDDSGSMDRLWLEQIVAEVRNLLKNQPQAKAYLVSHTDEVVFQGWVGAGVGSQEAIGAAVQFSGGTCAKSAYQAIEAAGKFDVLVHFTDCELPSWPKVPGRSKLIVAAFGSGATKPHCPPPPGAEIIPCQTR